MTMLGSGFRPRTIDDPLPAPVVPTDTERILAALSNLTVALQAAQAPPPPPQIIIPEPDLGAIVTAVNGLKPGANADDVARAVVAQLAPPAPAGDTTAMSETLERVAESLKALDFRMQAPTAMIGGGIVHFDPAQLNPDGTLKMTNDVTDRAARLVGHVTVDAAPVTQVREDPDIAVRAGRLFLGGSGQQTLTAAGNVRLAFQNPTGSGKTAYVYRLSGGGSALVYAHLYVNPTVGVPTTARPLNNLYFGNPTAAVCKVFADQSLTTALSGGSDSGIDVAFGANVHTDINEWPILIPAGVTLGINVPFTGSGTGTFNIYWEEA